MPDRPVVRFRPGLERFEERKLPSAVASTSHARAAERSAASEGAASQSGNAVPTPPFSKPGRLHHGFLAYRITNSNVHNNYSLQPSLISSQVLVQNAQPVPGQTYNILFITIRNATGQTFTASDGFTVRLKGAGLDFPSPTQTAVPILTGNQTWQPGHTIIFYVLTKQYYPVSQISGGFQVNLGGASSTLVPGPSGIFLRLKYNPATFAKTLDNIVAFGQGNQGGKGLAKGGIANTSVNEFVFSATQRIDYGGRF